MPKVAPLTFPLLVTVAMPVVVLVMKTPAPSLPSIFAPTRLANAFKAPSKIALRLPVISLLLSKRFIVAVLNTAVVEPEGRMMEPVSVTVRLSPSVSVLPPFRVVVAVVMLTSAAWALKS